MAKYESRFRGNFKDFLSYLDNGILTGSKSATFEEGSDFVKNDVYCAVRVYERYSAIGGGRVSLSIVLIGVDDDLFVSAISTGGSSALFYKINTVGEKKFLQNAVEIIEGYKTRR